MKQKLLKTLVLLCALIVGSATSWADTATLPNTQNLTTSFAYVGTDTHIQIKISSSNAYTNPLRFYANSKTTIKADDGYAIQSVTYEASSTGNYVTYAQNATVTPNVTPSVSDKNVTWTLDNVSEFTFTPGTQTRCNSITIVYTSTGGGGSDPVAVTDVSLDETLNLEYGQSETLSPTFTPADATNKNVTWTSDNTSVATVDASGKVTTVAVGTATITVTTEDGNFTDDCEVTVTAPEGKETAAPAAEEIFSESWSSTAGTGGNDGSWSGSIASGDIVADNTGWTYGNGYGAKDCVRLGKSSSGKGTATTPKLGTAGTLKLTFRAAAWDGSSEATEDALELSTVGGGTITPAKVSLAKGAWGSYEATITNATADTQIKFSGKNNNSNRYFLDDVVVEKAGVTITATLNSEGYATICSEYPLDFRSAEGYTAWQIAEVGKDGKITFSKVIEIVKGGTGLLLKGEADATITLKSSNSSTTLSGNKLVGTLAPTYVEAGTAYGLSGNKFVVNNAPGNISAGKAYIEATSIPAGVKDFTLVFEDETTGITESRTATREEVEAIFNLAGQRLSRMHKGVNIVNGKKILVK